MKENRIYPIWNHDYYFKMSLAMLAFDLVNDWIIASLWFIKIITLISATYSLVDEKLLILSNRGAND